MRPSLRQLALVSLITLLPAVSAFAQAGTVTRAAPRRAAKADSSGTSSNILPTVEITGFLTLLSAYDRVAYADMMQDGKKVYSSTFKSTWDHIREQHWVHDQDPFNVNQFAHPYQGAMMYGFARSTGHGFWTSLAHANVGSFLWKMAGETDPPSINDMITTGQAGSLLGEALYRMAYLVVTDKVTSSKKVNAYAAAAISPPAGFNRLVFGNRFDAGLSDKAPSTIWMIRLGATLDALSKDYSSPAALLRRDATAEFAMSYGLPGQPGYTYTRPLDYFDFQFSALSSAKNPVENVMIRGLLFGAKTSEGVTSRGIWGLYGSYDYISPYLFRVSSTALSLGTTRQYWVAPKLALQGSLLGGVGYGAAGSTIVIPSTPTNAAIRDYHFGVTPQALLALRLISGQRVMFDATGREYYVSGVGSDDKRGAEKIFRGNAGVTVRVIGNHALGAQFVASTRDARYGALPDKRLREGTVTITYSFLGPNRFNAVTWK